MAQAVAAGIAISVDPASTGPLREFGVERFLTEIATAELIFPNRDEALLLTGDAPAERAAELLSQQVRRGGGEAGVPGALAATGGQFAARSDPAPTEMVDSTGAGDAFAAGFSQPL